MFLSRLILNAHSRQVQRDWHSPLEMHRTVMRAFQDKAGPSPRAAHSVLWRLDFERHSRRLRLYVQSKDRPDWSFLSQDEYLLGPFCLDPGEENPGVTKEGQYPPPFRKHQNLRFRLRANPVERECMKDGKRMGIIGDQNQIAWLLRKTRLRTKQESGGFELAFKEMTQEGRPVRIPRCVAINEGLIRCRRGKEGPMLTFRSVLFEGVLEVTDPAAFVKTLQSGIGSGKAFGFGLLSVAPL